MDFSLAALSPEERAAMQESIAQKQRVTDLLRAAGQRANRHNNLAAVAQMANNPGIAKAAMLAQKNAQAEAAPVQMGNQGFMLPDQGEFVDSPMYTEQKQADRQSRAAALRASLEARREQTRLMEEGRNERAGQSNELRRLLAQQAEQGRQDRLSQSLALRELLAGKKSEEKAAAPQFKEADIQKLSAFADKKQLPRLLPQARQLLKAIEAAGDKDIPGLTSTDQMLVRAPGGTRLLSKDAIDNHTALQGILNALTRADAGLSQTQGEVVRQALETLNSVPASSQVRAQVLKKHILPILEQQRSAVLGSASPAALAEYRSRQQAIGGEVDWLDPLMGTPGPDPDQALIEKYLPKPKGK